jgi:hypothetical protein
VTRAEMRAAAAPGDGAWDTSWIDKLSSAVPSGIYALVRAQIPGCAYLPGD